MAGTAVEVVSEGQIAGPVSELEQLRLSLNAAVVDVERLRAALDAVCDLLDADAGVTGTNYASTANVATAATMTAFSISKVQ